MGMRELRVLEGQSKVVVRTRATGMLARLAHDLEIVSTEVTGTATVEGGKWAAEVVVPLFGDVLPRGAFVLLAFAASIGATVARIVAQPEMHQ